MKIKKLILKAQLGSSNNLAYKQNKNKQKKLTKNPQHHVLKGTFSIHKEMDLWLRTESCPDKNCGTSRSMPGLMGEVTEIEGRSSFWDSNELEPEKTKNNKMSLPISEQLNMLLLKVLDESIYRGHFIS